MLVMAREHDASLIMNGEVRYVDFRIKDDQKEIEVGLVVRVRRLALDELVNGAAERAVASDAKKGAKPEILMTLDAAADAAARAVSRIAAYRPVEGTVMNTAGKGFVVMNRGAGHGVKGKQEF